MTAHENAKSAKTPLNPFLKLALDLGPLAVFFVVNLNWGIFPATAAFMVVIAIALSASYALERRIAPIPLVTGAMVLVFGGLTLVLQDDLFIKIKPTIVNAIFASVLLGGLIFDKPLIKMALGNVFHLPDHAWRMLTLRYAGLFVFLALLNEFMWRNYSTDFWVAFKVWGVFPITVIFTLLQVPYITAHEIKQDTKHE
jgi:intracellular septation protein